jgi:hypothetical protein
MPDDQSSITPQCKCGKPLRHIGRCIGGPYRRADLPAKKTKFVDVLESELKACHETIKRIKSDIASRNDELRLAEAKLAPLRAMLEVYRDLKLPAPTPAKSVFVAPSLPVASQATDADKDEDYEPIEADFNQVEKWAAVRNLQFKSWNDLHFINDRRQQFELPPFKRKTGFKMGQSS